jgi:hypothetical protein
MFNFPLGSVSAELLIRNLPFINDSVGYWEKEAEIMNKLSGMLWNISRQIYQNYGNNSPSLALPTPYAPVILNMFFVTPLKSYSESKANKNSGGVR